MSIRFAMCRLVQGFLAASFLLTSAATLAGPKRCAAAQTGKANNRIEQRACRRSGDTGDMGTAMPASRKTGTDDKVAPEVLRRVRSGAHLEVVARDLRLTDSMREKLERIGARYHKATHRRLVITGGTRPPQRQAQLMFEKLRHGEDLLALYENKQAAGEVRNAYQEALAHGQRKSDTLRAIQTTVEAQVARGVFVSKHLKSGAADVRSRDMTPEREAAFRAAVAEESGVVLLDERKSAEPHLHLSL